MYYFLRIFDQANRLKVLLRFQKKKKKSQYLPSERSEISTAQTETARVVLHTSQFAQTRRTPQRARNRVTAIREREGLDDDYDVIHRRDLDLLSCGPAAAVAGDRRWRCCLQRARAQWAPNRATARAAAKCATRRNGGGGGNTPTDEVFYISTTAAATAAAAADVSAGYCGRSVFTILLSKKKHTRTCVMYRYCEVQKPTT